MAATYTENDTRSVQGKDLSEGRHPENNQRFGGGSHKSLPQNHFGGGAKGDNLQYGKHSERPGGHT